MKRIVKFGTGLVYTFLLSLILTACNETRYPTWLTDAAGLTETAPDSAIVVLNGLEERVADESEAVRMYYRLLRIKADDRAFKTHETDSDILEIVEFYEKTDDPILLPLAYYYAGSVYRDLNDGPQAMRYFQMALDVFPSDSLQKTKARTYSQLGYILMSQYLLDEAKDMFMRSYETDVRIRDTVGMVYNLCDIGRIYKRVEHYDSCMIYSLEALELAKTQNDSSLVYDISRDIASSYRAMGEYDSTLVYIKEALKHEESSRQTYNYSIAIKAYHALGMRDSVRFCYDMLMKVGSIYGRCAAYRTMAMMAMEEGRNAEALANLRMYVSTTDSVNKTKSADAVAKANALYDYTLRERHSTELEVENSRIKADVMMAVSVCLLLAMAMAGMVIYYRRRQRLMRVRIDGLRRIKDEMYAKSEQYIKDNERKIEELNMQMEQTAQRNQELNEELERQRRLLQNKNEIALHRMEEERIHRENITCSDIYRRIISIAKSGDGALSDDEWHEAEMLINTEYPNFSQRLDSMCRMSEHEHRVCLLLKMELSPSQIGVVTFRSRESLSSSRRRLYEKVTGRKGAPRDWDDIVRGL